MRCQGGIASSKRSDESKSIRLGSIRRLRQHIARDQSSSDLRTGHSLLCRTCLRSCARKTAPLGRQHLHRKTTCDMQRDRGMRYRVLGERLVAGRIITLAELAEGES